MISHHIIDFVWLPPAQFFVELLNPLVLGRACASFIEYLNRAIGSVQKGIMIRDSIMKYQGCGREDIILSYQQKVDEYERQVAEGRIFIDYENGKKDVRNELIRERNAVLLHYGYELL